MVIRPEIPRLRWATLALLGTLMAGWAGGCVAGESESPLGVATAREQAPTIGSLRGVPVPEPPNLGRFIRDRSAAVALGKALFWDMRAGSYNQACASCHFHAGADARLKNQLSPGLNNDNGLPLSTTFNPSANGTGGPNYDLGPSDFPFHRLADVNDRNSAVLFDTDDVCSSQGTFHAAYAGLSANNMVERCAVLPDAFAVGPTVVRRVEPRNTPTIINAAFNYRLFWDGRANNHFNGVSPFGPRDPGATVYVAQGNKVAPVRLDIQNAALASLAVGPPTNPFEMSCEGRTFPVIARKLFAMRPLALQEVDPTDGVLGPLRDPSGKGLSRSYADLIRAAFAKHHWDSTATVGGYSLMETNFSLFWGLAVQLYEATLIADDSRFDRFADGNASALTAQEQLGLSIFTGKGGCVNCHSGAELTSAGVSELDDESQVERMPMRDGGSAAYDRGFANTGVRPTVEDLGLGRTDPWGNPLSFTRQAQAGHHLEPFTVKPSLFEVSPGVPISPTERSSVDGAFKIPGLRNVELTWPYFHNGGILELEDVVRFYNRGGDRRGSDAVDTSGYGSTGTNVDEDIQPLGLTDAEQAALVAFLKALTDDRVRWEKAPFDHPSLVVANGAAGDETWTSSDGTSGHAADTALAIPAVGAQGRAAKGLGPLQ
jgi:cytochrome c peroxidase